ncbi:MAG: DNA polymerase I [Methylobacteriaceae bacterium]|jgi:DNA polymerase-1|nr:DNA polymerase I [Methylobacteriaceae bacterium]
MSEQSNPNRNVVFLIDGSSFVFRAYFQSQHQGAKYNNRLSDGLPTGAVRLFCAKLLQFLRDGAAGIVPSHIGVVFDPKGGSFRNGIYPDYKGHRPDAPEDLKIQMPLMRDAVRAFGLPPLEVPGYEADDLIAAYAVDAERAGYDVLIVSSDKDLMQLVDEHIRFFDFESGRPGTPGYRPERNLDVAGVMEKWDGTPPDKIGDVLALMGDASDNVPGIPGIGPKTAIQLIRDYGDLETLLARAGEIKQPKRRDSLIDHADDARLSRRLVTLALDAPLPVPLEELKVKPLDAARAIAFLKAMEFPQLTRRIADLYRVNAAAVPADPALSAGATLFDTPAATEDHAGESAPGESPVADLAAVTEERRRAVISLPVTLDDYEIIRDAPSLSAWVRLIADQGYVAVDTETTSLDAMSCELVGISLAVAPNRACYIPLGHRDAADDLFGGGRAEGQMDPQQALALLKPVLEDPGILKIGQNLKYDFMVFSRYGVTPAAMDDTMLMSYVLDAGKGPHGMDELALRHLGYTTIHYADVAGSGKNAVSFDRVKIAAAARYAAEDADITLRLWQVLKPRLAPENKTALYETADRPLIDIIARMEMRGVLVDRAILSRLSGEFAAKLQELEQEIHTLAGERFMISSPKQIGDILFGKLGLPGAKKTAGGQWATPATLLEDLAGEGHALPAKILDWRQLAKLKSTYTDALPGFINAKTGRVHTSFHPASTNTGRFASSDPNLQNIPVRTEEGRRIRSAFIADAGYQLVSADYSQIELRVLAHIADIPQLRQAFADGVDIHAATASAMFGVPLSEMTPELRRRAKTINFGIIYGISGFGLAQRLGIGQSEATSFINQYFRRFPGIQDYIEGTKRFCRENGYVQTLFGRTIHYPQLATAGPRERGGIERAAINAPIQGSAADIIRRAMTRMEEALKRENLTARMLLQVHDELVFEVPDAEVEATIPVVKRVMEQAAAPAVAMRVPLAVDAHAARNWDEAH